MINPGSLTWTCHVCKDERPDDKISVHSTTKLVGRIEIQQNVRYCNDRILCVNDAQNVSFVG